jgi:hypothetical protein
MTRKRRRKRKKIFFKSYNNYQKTKKKQEQEEIDNLRNMNFRYIFLYIYQLNVVYRFFKSIKNLNKHKQSLIRIKSST